jgi:hypothetical protein
VLVTRGQRHQAILGVVSQVGDARAQRAPGLVAVLVVAELVHPGHHYGMGLNQGAVGASARLGAIGVGPDGPGRLGQAAKVADGRVLVVGADAAPGPRDGAVSPPAMEGLASSRCASHSGFDLILPAGLAS